MQTRYIYYMKIKAELEKLNKLKKSLENKVERLENGKIIFKRERIEKQEYENSEIRMNNEIDIIDNEIRIMKAQIQKVEVRLDLLTEKIEELMIQMQNNPEMKKQIDESMVKKEERKLKKINKDKKEIEDKLNRLDEIENLIKKHPVLENYLKSILWTTKRINDLNDEFEVMKIIGRENVEQYEIKNRKNRVKNILLPDLQRILEDRKKVLMDYINKKNLNIYENDIDDLAENGFILEGKEIDFSKTIEDYKFKLNIKKKECENFINRHIENNSMIIESENDKKKGYKGYVDTKWRIYTTDQSEKHESTRRNSLRHLFKNMVNIFQERKSHKDYIDAEWRPCITNYHQENKSKKGDSFTQENIISIFREEEPNYIIDVSEEQTLKSTAENELRNQGINSENNKKSKFMRELNYNVSATETTNKKFISNEQKSNKKNQEEQK